jgi:hypothetical protein
VIALFVAKDLSQQDEVEQIRLRVAELENREAVRQAAEDAQVSVFPPPSFLKPPGDADPP